MKIRGYASACHAQRQSATAKSMRGSRTYEALTEACYRRIRVFARLAALPGCSPRRSSTVEEVALLCVSNRAVRTNVGRQYAAGAQGVAVLAGRRR